MFPWSVRCRAGGHAPEGTAASWTELVPVPGCGGLGVASGHRESHRLMSVMIEVAALSYCLLLNCAFLKHYKTSYVLPMTGILKEELSDSSLQCESLNAAEVLRLLLLLLELELKAPCPLLSSILLHNSSERAILSSVVPFSSSSSSSSVVVASLATSVTTCSPRDSVASGLLRRRLCRGSGVMQGGGEGATVGDPIQRLLVAGPTSTCRPGLHSVFSFLSFGVRMSQFDEIATS